MLYELSLNNPAAMGSEDINLIRARYWSVVDNECEEAEVRFFTWFIPQFIFPKTKLPERKSLLEALRDYGEFWVQTWFEA